MAAGTVEMKTVSVTRMHMMAAETVVMKTISIHNMAAGAVAMKTISTAQGTCSDGDYQCNTR